MKTRGFQRMFWCWLVIWLAAGMSAWAEDGNNKQPSKPTEMQGETRIKERTAERIKSTDLRAVQKGVSYGGAVPEMVKSGHPWQALNPFAPRKHGNGETNQVRDPVTGKTRGIALFSLHF